MKVADSLPWLWVSFVVSLAPPLNDRPCLSLIDAVHLEDVPDELQTGFELRLDDLIGTEMMQAAELLLATRARDDIDARVGLMDERDGCLSGQRIGDRESHRAGVLHTNAAEHFRVSGIAVERREPRRPSTAD